MNFERTDGADDDAGEDGPLTDDDDGSLTDAVLGSTPDPRTQMRRVRDLKTYPGLRAPSPGRQ